MNETTPTNDAPAPIEQPPLKGVAKKIAEANKKLEQAKESHAREIELLLKMSSMIDKLPDEIADKCGVYGAQIDIDNLTRSESLIVIDTLKAGKWSKTVNPSMPDKIDYETAIDGVTVRLWAAGPPDSCRVIEFEEEVPATKIIRRRLVCSGGEV
jgi:hypothetical protein